MPEPGQIEIDSAGIGLRWTRLAEVKPGDTILGGWRPFPVVQSIETREDGSMRLIFSDTHWGPWGRDHDLMPVEVKRD